MAKAYELELKDIVERDPLAPMFEQDKELVWRFRMYLLENLPTSLPKLLSSVKWYQHKDVAVVSGRVMPLNGGIFNCMYDVSCSLDVYYYLVGTIILSSYKPTATVYACTTCTV